MIINNVEELKKDIMIDSFTFGDKETISEDLQTVINGLEKAIIKKDYVALNNTGYTTTIDLDEDTNKLINFNIESDGSITILFDYDINVELPR